MTLGFTTIINETPNYFVEKIWQSLFESSERTLSKIYADYLMRHVTVFGKEWDIDASQDVKPKLHTVRNDRHNRWRTGLDIHFVINNRTSERFQFAPVRKSILVQDIVLFTTPEKKATKFNVVIDGNPLNILEIEQFAWNDGFQNTEELFKYFNKPFKGKLIHWTNLKYK